MGGEASSPQHVYKCLIAWRVVWALLEIPIHMQIIVLAAARKLWGWSFAAHDWFSFVMMQIPGFANWLSFFRWTSSFGCYVISFSLLCKVIALETKSFLHVVMTRCLPHPKQREICFTSIKICFSPIFIFRCSFRIQLTTCGGEENRNRHWGVGWGWRQSGQAAKMHRSSLLISEV